MDRWIYFINWVRLGGSTLGGLYSEVQVHQGEDQSLEVQHEVEEGGETLRVLAVLHLAKRAYLGCLELVLLPIQPNFQCLLPCLIWLGPLLRRMFQYPTRSNDLLELINHYIVSVDCFRNVLPSFLMISSFLYSVQL